MGKKTWAAITEEEIARARRGGAIWALAYLPLLKIAAGFECELKTSVRELAELFSLADFRAVKRALEALTAAGFITLEKGVKGTIIKVLSIAEMPVDKNVIAGVEQGTTPALSNPQHSVEQNTTLTPFLSPYNPLSNPAKVILINIKQQKAIKTIDRAAESGTFFDLPEAKNSKTETNRDSEIKNLLSLDRDIGTFRAKPKTAAQTYAAWFIRRYNPAFYGYADKSATGSWYEENCKTLNRILKMANGDFSIAQECTLLTEEQMNRWGEKNPDITWGLRAVAKSMPDNLEIVLKKLRGNEIKQARISGDI